MKTLSALLFASALIGAVATPALADAPITARAATDEKAAFEADRQAILAMTGNFHVTFDLHETTSWRKDYTPIPAKVMGGDESVRVIEDTGRHIVLQHLLVVKGEDNKSHVVKHWRQDWTYEPASVLTYAGEGQWKTEDVPAALRAGC